MNLTPKQERFCQEMARKDSTQIEAHRIAYATGKYTDKQRYEDASKLFKMPSIRQRIQQLRQPTIEKLNYTLETAVKELEEARLLAKRLNKPEAMINAIVGKAKILGLGLEKNRETATTLINEQNNSQVNIVFTSKPQEVNDGE